MGCQICRLRMENNPPGVSIAAQTGTKTVSVSFSACNRYTDTFDFLIPLVTDENIEETIAARTDWITVFIKTRTAIFVALNTEQGSFFLSKCAPTAAARN